MEDSAAQRAVNAKDYLVTEQGIDASRISVATGTTDGQTVENYLVPAGATFSTDVTGHDAGGRDGSEAAGTQAAGRASPEEEGCAVSRAALRLFLRAPSSARWGSQNLKRFLLQEIEADR